MASSAASSAVSSDKGASEHVVSSSRMPPLSARFFDSGEETQPKRDSKLKRRDDDALPELLLARPDAFSDGDLSRQRLRVSTIEADRPTSADQGAYLTEMRAGMFVTSFHISRRILDPSSMTMRSTCSNARGYTSFGTLSHCCSCWLASAKE